MLILKLSQGMQQIANYLLDFWIYIIVVLNTNYLPSILLNNLNVLSVREIILRLLVTTQVEKQAA